MTAPHPARRSDTEALLDRLGVNWTFEPAMDTGTVDGPASLANQVRNEALRPEVVERYAAAMARGDLFPAIIVRVARDRRIIVGGVHRHHARVAAEQGAEAAYLIACDDATATRVAVEDNAHHGLPLTTAERIRHAATLIAAGMSQGEAAAIVGIGQGRLSAATSAHAAVTRCRDLAHSEVTTRFARLPESVRYAVSQVDDDTVFAAVAALAADCALPAAVIAPIVRAVDGLDVTEALAYVGTEREEHHTRATSRDGNVRRSSRTARARLEAALAEIRALRPVDVDDTCPNDDVRRRLEASIRAAAAVLAPTQRLLEETMKAGAA